MHTWRCIPCRQLQWIGIHILLPSIGERLNRNMGVMHQSCSPHRNYRYTIRNVLMKMCNKPCTFGSIWQTSNWQKLFVTHMSFWKFSDLIYWLSWRLVIWFHFLRGRWGWGQPRQNNAASGHMLIVWYGFLEQQEAREELHLKMCFQLKPVKIIIRMIS